MTVLSIDPGRGVKPSIGYCLFTEDGHEIHRGEMTWNELCGSLFPTTHYGLSFYVPGVPPPLKHVEHLVNRVVIENFVNDPRVKRGGQTNGASEVIGAVEFCADSCGIPFIRRDRSTLTAAKAHAGYVQTLKHLPHKDAAFVHGYSDFVERGILHAVGIGDTL